MRALLTLLLLTLVSATAALGQQQEKMIDRVLKKPDETLQYDTRKSAFGTDRGYIAKKSAPVQEFTGSHAFAARSYDAKSFAGSQEAWMAHSQYATREAGTKGKYEIPNADKSPAVKTMAVNEAREAGKTVETRSADTRGFFAKGRSQDRFDAEKGVPKGTTPLGYTGEMKPMTIDDIRTLLNKNK